MMDIPPKNRYYYYYTAIDTFWSGLSRESLDAWLNAEREEDKTRHKHQVTPFPFIVDHYDKLSLCFDKFVHTFLPDYLSSHNITSSIPSLIIRDLRDVDYNTRRAFRKLWRMRKNFFKIFVISLSPLYAIDDPHMFKIWEYFQVKRRTKYKTKYTNQDYENLIAYLTTPVNGKYPKFSEARQIYGISRSALDKYCYRTYDDPFGEYIHSLGIRRRHNANG